MYEWKSMVAQNYRKNASTYLLPLLIQPAVTRSRPTFPSFPPQPCSLPFAHVRLFAFVPVRLPVCLTPVCGVVLEPHVLSHSGAKCRAGRDTWNEIKTTEELEATQVIQTPHLRKRQGAKTLTQLNIVVEQNRQTDQGLGAQWLNTPGREGWWDTGEHMRGGSQGRETQGK